VKVTQVLGPVGLRRYHGARALSLRDGVGARHRLNQLGQALSAAIRHQPDEHHRATALAQEGNHKDPVHLQRERVRGRTLGLAAISGTSISSRSIISTIIITATAREGLGPLELEAEGVGVEGEGRELQSSSRQRLCV
jgi:hypothetical protein